jgi:hypothetical protein
MARRPDPVEYDRPLTEPELKDRTHQLSMLSPHHVADAYRRAYEACRMDGERLPPRQFGAGTGRGVEVVMEVAQARPSAQRVIADQRSPRAG